MSGSNRALLLVDTNVILDVLCNREPFVDASEKILNLCEGGYFDGRISALSIANIAYILRKELTPEMMGSVIDSLDISVGIEALSPRDLKNAAAMAWPDYEDAIQCATARRIGAGFIITRNVKDFVESSIEAIAPADFLKRMRMHE